MSLKVCRPTFHTATTVVMHMDESTARERAIQRAFGQAVRARRETLRLSQEEVAQRAGLHRTYISDVERGARNVALNTIARLADALSVSVVDLFAAEIFHGSSPGTEDSPGE